VQFHARMALQTDGANSATTVPLTERGLVFCVSKLEKWRLDSIAKLRELQYMVAVEKQKVESLNRKARRAEVQVDAL
jgi:transcription initiation factor TFIID subunit TAF12